MGFTDDDFFDKEFEEPGQPRSRRRVLMIAGGVIALLVIVAVLVLVVVGRSQDADTPTATPTPMAVPTSTHTPAAESPVAATAPPPAPSDTPTRPPPRPTNTSRPTAAATAVETPTPVVDAVVSADEVRLRPGATTWWYPRQRLPAGTELELLGYDADFADWVYVRTADGSAEGWTQTAGLQINRSLSSLPHVTPRPTLTSTPAMPSPTPTLFVLCEGGPLRLDVWPVGHSCTGSGWISIIFIEGHGGDCVYTYAWDGVVRGGPMTGSMTFEVESADRVAIVGTGSVTSAGQTVSKDLYMAAPDCD